MIPAGRGLDARLWELTGGVVVARDWPCYLDEETGNLVAAPRRRPTGECHPVYVGQHGIWPADEYGDVSVEPVPCFSTDDAAALLLCERLRAMGWWVTVILKPATSKATSYYCVVEQRREKHGVGFYAATLHEAVAPAAYAALAPEGE